MKTKIGMLLGVVLCLSIPLPAMIIHNHCEDKEDGIRTESGVFNDDYLFLGKELHFSGEAEDLYFLGERLTFTGKTKLGIVALCEKLIVSGASGNGIIAAGGDIVVDGAITGTSFIGCKSLSISDIGSVSGDLFAGCGTIIIDGKLNGDLHAGAGKLVVNSVINGNVTMYGGRIIIGKQGRINGVLRYSTKEKLSEEDLSKVGSAIIIDKNIKWHSFGKFTKTTIGLLIGLGFLLSYVIIASLLLFIPAFRKLDVKQPAGTFWRTGLWGLIPVLMYPAIIVLCFALVITIPLALVLILAIVPLFFVATIIGTTLLGKYLASTLKWKVEKRHSQFFIGVLPGVILSMIPFVNFLAFIFISALGWGVYLSFLFKKDLAAAIDSLKSN
jgi:cytoskeletal protein CcmA (bactofilin family)